MSDYRQQAVRGSAFTAAGAALAYVTTLFVAPTALHAGSLLLGGLLLLAAYYATGRIDTLAGAWLIPVIAGVLFVASPTVDAVQDASLALALLGLAGGATAPLVARAARFGESIGNR